MSNAAHSNENERVDFFPFPRKRVEKPLRRGAAQIRSADVAFPRNAAFPHADVFDEQRERFRGAFELRKLRVPFLFARDGGGNAGDADAFEFQERHAAGTVLFFPRGDNREKIAERF